MQETSALYKQIISGQHWKETSLAIGESGRLITERNDVITFAGTSILISRSGGDSGYGENWLMSMSTSRSMFANDTPEVGCCISGEIDVKLLKPIADIPRMAMLTPYVRVANGVAASEWIQKGVFFIDSRETSEDAAGNTVLTIHGYDAMLKAEQPYSGALLNWPSTDIQVVRDIAAYMGVSLDVRTVNIMTHGYAVQLPSAYTMREVLSSIAAMYCGCFIMSDVGELRLVRLNEIPAETRYLVDNAGFVLMFGGDRILV